LLLLLFYFFLNFYPRSKDPGG